MQINLANTRLFRGMEPSDIEEMLGCLHAKEHAFQKGEIIFPEGTATAVSYTHLTNARMLTARIEKKASRTKPLTSTPMTRIRPATPAATSARSRRPPMSTATAIGARTARTTGTNARMLTARIEKKASRTRPVSYTHLDVYKRQLLVNTSGADIKEMSSALCGYLETLFE